MCVVELLAYVCCFSIAWWGRKWPTVGTYMGGAISLLIAILLMMYTPGTVLYMLPVMYTPGMVLYILPMMYTPGMV